jgi:hypothetical protein
MAIKHFVYLFSPFKASGSSIQSDMIDIVIEVCGVKKLSECVDLTPTPEMILPCPEMQKYFSQIVPVLQQYLLAKYPDVYKDLDETSIKKTFKDAKFYQVGLHINIYC